KDLMLKITKLCRSAPGRTSVSHTPIRVRPRITLPSPSAGEHSHSRTVGGGGRTMDESRFLRPSSAVDATRAHSPHHHLRDPTMPVKYVAAFVVVLCIGLLPSNAALAAR